MSRRRARANQRARSLHTFFSGSFITAGRARSGETRRDLETPRDTRAASGSCCEPSPPPDPAPGPRTRTRTTMLPLPHVVLLALATRTLAGPEPIRCASCTLERLSQCPAVARGCAEVLREPGCGCCPACALPAGELCGIYTAPCGSGLRCTPRPGDPRPLHALTRGQAVCRARTEAPATPEPQQNPGRPPRQRSSGVPARTRSSTFIHSCR